MEARMGNGSRQRWTEQRTKKEPTLYDEWLAQEREARQSPTPRDNTSRSGDTTGVAASPNGSTSISPAIAAAATIRAVSPEAASPADSSARRDRYDGDGMAGAMRATSFERAFIPRSVTPTPGTTTTIVGGPAAISGTSPGTQKPRRLVKDREWQREARMLSHSPPSSRAGSGASGMPARNSSKSNGHHTPVLVGSDRESALNAASAAAAARPRTRTLEDRNGAASPPHFLHRSRNRITSINSLSAGSQYLASVPANTTPPSAPSLSSLRSTSTDQSTDVQGRRSTSPTSSSTAGSVTSGSNAASASARRILHLMKTLNGRMSGKIVVRRDAEEPWKEIYCYIQEETASMMYEPRGVESTPARTLVSGLRGCGVRPNVDGETPYLEVNLPQTDMEIHIKLLTQADFDAWYAALLYWQSLGVPVGQRRGSATSATAVKPPLPPRTTPASHFRERAGSSKSDRRKSVVSSLREAPVIKIGKMIYWDTNVRYSSAPAPGSSAHGRSPSGRPAAYRMQSHGSRRWRRISGQLRENGELKLHADSDNSLISVVQLSQLSRCAIQRLDSSVLDDDFCIAVYPQYTPNPTSGQPGFIRPIFLSLENRVLYEVWFVLLRAFTIPQLYGPRLPTFDGANGHSESNKDLENMLATTTTDMFRMERALNIRVVEAKMHPPTGVSSPDLGFAGGKGHAAGAKGDPHGYYAEVLLDNETRGKTAVKYDGLSPFWAETFEFQDLPPVLTSTSIVIKRRPPESAHTREQHESRLVHEAYGFSNDQYGGFTGVTFDVVCGKVEIYLSELEENKEVEKWWPVINSYGQRVGEVLIKARAEEDVILMSRDYQPLGELLHRFSNGITLQIAQMIPGELKRVSDCLLNIYQVSGKAADWIMALVEEEFDSMHRETPISRLWFSRRAGVESSGATASPISATHDRELIVRDLNKNATVEANLLFRGNTLLTKTVDTHMRRLGKEYLEATLAEKTREINDKDPECEVDPNRVGSSHELERNWRRLLTITHDVWKTIVASKQKCPVELRVIFRHIRACAEDRYGDFLRSVSYSSVSGFLFLRFLCPAVLNPQLFGLLKDDVKPRARRTFTLIAKSLQTMSNMASFGTKEQWMEPMNVFLSQNRESFKAFVDDMCYVPTTRPAAMTPNSQNGSPTWDASNWASEEHFSYKTPRTIMQRLPPTSREGFPSLPFLIDQARAYAELVQLWLEATTSMSLDAENTVIGRSHAELMAAIKASEGDLLAFHEICTSLHKRTQECLNRAERAERPHSALSFKLEELIDSLQTNANNLDSSDELSLQHDDVVTKHGSVSTVLPVLPDHRNRTWDVSTDDDDDHKSLEDRMTRLYDPTPSTTSTHSTTDLDSAQNSPSPFPAGNGSKPRDSLRRASRQIDSRTSETASPSPSSTSASASASVSVSNLSSAVSSDTEGGRGTTALPSYERELQHRERREAAKAKIQQTVEAARIRDRTIKDKSHHRVKTPIVSSLRSKRKEKEGRSAGGSMSEARHLSYDG